MVEVLVVDRAAMFGGVWPQGFVALEGRAGTELLARIADLAHFEDRPAAERNPGWKQWIPYCLLRCQGGVFRVQRTTGQSEARLHGQWSIGLGGHIEPEDLSQAAAPGRAIDPRIFPRSLQRELAEELDIQGTRDFPEPWFVGLLNDDRSAVGQVHAGLVYVWDLPLPLAAARDEVRVREISKMRGGFGSLVEFAELWQDPAQFESWSQFLVRSGLVGPMGASACL
jgi:predicted NUDIX family phosphoesterase